jgi:4-amino-4-deoxy-L-arabinose transferase-like glycosyltransferase
MSSDAAPAAPAESSGHLAIVLGLCAVALGLRILHLAAVATDLLAEPPPMGMDRWVQMHIAEAIAAGDLVGGWSSGFDSGPAYAYAIALPYWLGGGRWIVPIVMQILLGALTPLLAFEVGRRLGGTSVGLVAAALTVLYIPFIFYEVLLVRFSLLPVVTFALLAVWLAIPAWRGMPGFVVGGLLLGIFTILRPNGIVCVPLVVGWGLVQCSSWSRRAGGVAAVAAGIGLVAVPLALREHAAGSRRLATSLWGIHFYIGNHAEADGSYTSVPDVSEDIVGHVVDARRLAETAEGRTLSPTEVSLYWFHRGLAFAMADPLDWIRLQGRKLRLMLAPEEYGTFGDDFEYHAELSSVLRLPLVSFGTMLPVAVLGATLVACGSAGRLVLLFVLGYAVSLLPFFVVARYRLPLAPPLLALAAVALVELERRLRRRSWWSLLVGLAVVAAVGATTARGWQEAAGMVGLVTVGMILAAAAPRPSQSTT